MEISELDDRGTVFSRESPPNTFFDIASIHLITTNTIHALSKLIPESRIEARRFRPNIIIDVPEEEGFIEESWIGKTIQIGNCVLQVKSLELCNEKFRTLPAHIYINDLIKRISLDNYLL